MSNVWFTSDWHLGHPASARIRGFDTVEEHDATIINNIKTMCGKKDKLFILGDVAWNMNSIEQLEDLPQTKELIIGNHDTLNTQVYLKYFTKVHGFRKYKNFWLSHCPIHPQELFRCFGNICGHEHMSDMYGNVHGHLHNGAATPPLALPYFNVNVDFNDYKPINLDTIIEAYNE